MILVLNLPTINRSNTNQCSNHVISFTFGVDSTYNLCQNYDQITHAVYIREMDHSSKIENFESNLIDFVTSMKIQPIVLETNFKYEFQHSIKLTGTNFAVFTSDAMVLATVYPLGIGLIYFNGFGINHPTERFPCLMGQHYDLVKYYHSNEFQGQYVDCYRIDKLKYIWENCPELIPKLRFCGELTKNHLNCYKCGKCMKTVAYMKMLGIDVPGTDHITPEIASNLPIKTLSGKYFAETYKKIYEEYIKPVQSTK